MIKASPAAHRIMTTTIRSILPIIPEKRSMSSCKILTAATSSAIRLNMDETKDLLARAGYALSPCDKRDIIFSFFIEHKVFDMIEIDIALEEHGLPCFIE